MRIKFTTLFAMLLLGAATSMAQLSWSYDGETLPDGATLTVNDNSANLSAGIAVGINNASDTSVEAVVSCQVEENTGNWMLIWCCGINCYNENKLISNPFPIDPNTIYDGFHVQMVGTTTGTATVKFTVTDGTSSSTVNVVVVVDDDDSNNGITVGQASVDNIAASKRSISLTGDVLTVRGARAGQQVRVIDLTGRHVASMAVTADGTQRYDLRLGRGVYLVALQEKGRTTYAQKVISK